MRLPGDKTSEQLARDEAMLIDLDRQREEVRRRIEAARERLVANREATPARLPVLKEPRAMSSAEKVALFRGLFRGRPDVFPKLWVNRRSGKKGYAPACANEWVDGVCEKPRVKCGECPNQAFIAVDDQVVVDHLQGRHVIGVYPLLDDETCWFLAVDFDKGSWQDDARAFVDTCQGMGVPVAVERSRSGNGAHVWFFFTSPLPAATARKMGCYLLTETMVRRHQLGMDSYDRLFPNQDTMPRGGFGNLIALPLQREPRKLDNTVFIDDRFQPYADQWGFLAALPRIAPIDAEAIAREAERQGQVVGVRLGDSDDYTETPWLRPASSRPRVRRVDEPVPKMIRAAFAQKLFVEKVGLPSGLLDQIKRIAAFQNPEFYKKQSMRLSTALTPRVIACAEDLPKHVGLPRGCLVELRDLLAEYGSELKVDDHRELGAPIDLRFQGRLTPVQSEAARALLRHDMGVFVAPPGIGKTVLGTYLIAARATSTLVLVHRQPLLDQWVAQLSIFLGIDGKEIGRIGGGKRTPNGRLDVAMLQSLVRNGEVDASIQTYGHVIVDECHHLPAVSFERVLSAAKARYVTGLTATLRRRDGHHPITEMQLGPVRHTVEPRSQAAQHQFERRLVVRETNFHLGIDAGAAGIQGIYASLARDEDRNSLILNDVILALEDGRSPILLTERRDHLDYFADRLRKFARHLVVLQGGKSAKERRDVAAQLAAIPAGEERLIIATGRYIGEGFDDVRLDALFLTLPVSWKGTLVQYAGRLHRSHPDKTEVRIYDYVDRSVPMLARMFERRLRGYSAMGYSRGSEATLKPRVDE